MNVNGLQSRIAGTVTTATSAGYEDLRQSLVWNGNKPARSPELIVHVANEQDVVEAVRFARAERLKVAVRGRGHSWCGFSLRDGSLLIDLGRLDQVTIDREARTATIQPAIRSQDLSRMLEAQGLAFPVGHCPTVPLGGFLLNGGLGWNSNAWRPGCFSIQAAHVVTANGELVVANAEHNAELFWALRGAGPGFFAVMTKLFLKLYPMPRAITTSQYFYPLSCAQELGAWFSGIVGTLPKEVEVLIFFAPAPPDIAEPCRSSNGYTAILSATAFLDSASDAARTLSILDRSPLANQCLKKTLNQPTLVSDLLDMGGGLWPEHHRYVADTVWSNTPPGQVLGLLSDHFLRAPSQQSLGTVWFSTGPDGVASPHPDAAFSMTASTLTLCYAIWKRPEDDAAHTAWHGQMISALDQFAVGHYVGESDIVRDPLRHERSYAPANWQRLQALRRKYDPDGLFLGPYPKR